MKVSLLSVIRLSIAILITAVGYILSSWVLKSFIPVNFGEITFMISGIVSGFIVYIWLPTITEKFRKIFQARVDYFVTSSLDSVFRAYFLNYFKKQIKLPESVEGDYENGLLLDTSAIIDGRLFDIFRFGFLNYKLIIPSYILDEVGNLADSKDLTKKKRGKEALKGLENLKKLNSVSVLSIELDKDDVVDRKLIKLGVEKNLPIISLDMNLMKMAMISGVKVLNINELANSLRQKYLPGDKFNVVISHEGKEKFQQVAYLGDGTMIIIENCQSRAGESLLIEITKSLQTASGKMLFAKQN